MYTDYDTKMILYVHFEYRMLRTQAIQTIQAKYKTRIKQMCEVSAKVVVRKSTLKLNIING